MTQDMMRDMIQTAFSGIPNPLALARVAGFYREGLIQVLKLPHHALVTFAMKSIRKTLFTVYRVLTIFARFVSLTT